jgi:hypothetical protein
MEDPGFYHQRLEMGMKFIQNDPARKYEAGFEVKVVISDCGKINLDPDEQVTFVTSGGREYDVARKSWGFYATPSLNGRLKNFGLRAVLVKNRINRFFVLLVEEGKEDLFLDYAAKEPLEIICWLDNEEHLRELETKIKEYGIQTEAP